MSNTIEQPILRRGGLLLLIILFSAIPPLCIDLYVPALPTMTEQLHTTDSLSGLTLSLFFLFLAVGNLFLAALSDRYGRKPILLICAVVAIVFNITCAISDNILAILAFRVLQGIAGGGMVAVGIALVKDCFEGEMMGKMLALTVAISLIAPLIAPVVGTAILQFAGWRGTFWFSAILMIVALLGIIAYRETLPKELRGDKTAGQALGEIFTFARDVRFVAMTLICCFLGAAYMAFVNSSSFILIDHFGLTEIRFTVIFVLSTLIGVLGAFVYMGVPKISVKKGSIILLVLAIVSALAVIFLGHLGPVVFALACCPWLFSNNFIHPMYTNAQLDGIEPNRAGAASSFINFVVSVFCGLGMITISSGLFSDYITGMGVIMAVCFVGMIVTFLTTWGRMFPKDK